MWKHLALVYLSGPLENILSLLMYFLVLHSILIAIKTNLTLPYLSMIPFHNPTRGHLPDPNWVRLLILFSWCQMCDFKSYQNFAK